MSDMYDKLIQNPDEYFHKLLAVKWFDEWCDEDIEILKKALQDAADENSEYMVYCLSDYTLETSGLSTAQDYDNLLKDLFGAFEFDISFETQQEGDMIEISFNIPEGKETLRFEQEDDWINEDILDFINDRVIAAYGEERVLHPLPPSESAVELVFHYPDVIDAAYDEGVIPDDSYFLNKEQ